jgi:hypothetical protein
LNEDEQAEGNQHQRVQDVSPAPDHLSDGGAGGKEPARGAPDADQDQEDRDIDGDPGDPGSGEDRHVHADVVTAVSEGD